MIQNNCNELSVTLQEKKGAQRKLEIQLRAYNDGIAFRYIYTEQGSGDSIFIMDEVSEFNLASGGNARWIPAYRDNRYDQRRRPRIYRVARFSGRWKLRSADLCRRSRNHLAK